MKNLFLSFGIVAMTLTSCSSDDSTSDSSATLVKTEIEHFSDGSSNTNNYTYDGNKIVSVVDSQGEMITFTYTGDLITKIKYYGVVELDQEDIYTYNSSGQLVEFVMLVYGVDWGKREVYVYNTDGTISVTEYAGDLDSQTNPNGSGTITFLANGEIGSLTDTGQTLVYSYDNKNNYLKNITGYDKIAFANSEVDGINHNMISRANGSDVTTMAYTYNAAGYPVTSSEEYNGEITTKEYFYE